MAQPLDPMAVLQQQQAQVSGQQGGGSVLPTSHAPSKRQASNAGKSPQLAGLVNTLAGQDLIGEGQAMQARGRETMMAPKNYQYIDGQLVGMGKDWRNMLSGSLQGHWGRKKVQQGIDAEIEAGRAQLDAEVMAEAQQRREIVEYLVGKGMSEAEAVQTAKMVAAGYINVKDVLAAGESDLKSMSEMPSELRRQVGIVVDATKNIDGAYSSLIEDGTFSDMAFVPGSDAYRQKMRIRKALKSVLRLKSGAAIPESEIEEEVENMMPGITDRDAMQIEKMNMIRQELSTMRAAVTGGYDLPPELVAGWSTPMEPTSKPGDADSRIPQEAVDMLKADPSLADYFDEQFGPGSARSVLGG